MEQIYTVKVKCKPDPSLNYPSERTYSSSTVGGLAISHFFLAILALTLCTAGYQPQAWRGEYFGGILLILGGVFAGLTGLLAWKKWYIDHHIRWFLLAAIVAGCCALTSITLTTIILVNPSIQRDQELDNTSLPLFNSSFDAEAEETNLTHIETRTKREVTFELKQTTPHELYIHLLLASFMEFCLSVLSIRIGWKGVRNSLRSKPATPTRTEGVGGCEEKQPDILEHHQKVVGDQKLSNYSNVVKELCRLQKNSMLGDGPLSQDIVSAFCINQEHNKAFPLPETQQEYKERMEKFLSYQPQSYDEIS